MREAIRLSREGMERGDGGPFGAVVTMGDSIVGFGWNRVTSRNDPTAHAEVVAIRDACRKLGTFSLEGCEIYCSCEPCPMCLAAIHWARLEKVHHAATDEDAAAAGFDDRAIYAEVRKPAAERTMPTTQGLREEAAKVFQEWKKKADRVEY
jgi:tRNA(Arg) A34 adenosine deaminase TadA